MFALCRVCRRAVHSYDVPPMHFEEFLNDQPYSDGWTQPSTVWVHVVKPIEEHLSVPLPGILDRRLMCADCRQPQVYEHRHGWHCANEHCTGLDND